MSSTIRGNDSFDSSLIDYSKMPVGSVINVVTRYDDTVSAAGSATQWTYWLDTYITLKKSNSKLIIDGVCGLDTTDDGTVQLQWNLNGGDWNSDTNLNSRNYTYSGLGDFAWAHKSNSGPFPFPLHNFLNCSSIGAGVGSTVGIRVAAMNESGAVFYNRSKDGVDNSVNYATSRSRMTLMEVAQ